MAYLIRWTYKGQQMGSGCGTAAFAMLIVQGLTDRGRLDIEIVDPGGRAIDSEELVRQAAEARAQREAKVVLPGGSGDQAANEGRAVEPRSAAQRRKAR